MRKLASIQRVNGVFPIPDADRLELVQELGWKCVGGKNEFHVGDLVVYFEIDSFLPICDEFEFLRKNSYKNNEYMGEGFKLKTMKFRGEIYRWAGECSSPFFCVMNSTVGGIMDMFSK